LCLSWRYALFSKLSEKRRIRLSTRMSDAISIAHTSAEPSPACGNAARAASLANLTRLLAAHFGVRPLSVYEAGGGSTSYIPLDALNVSHITLVDIDPRQVDRCKHLLKWPDAGKPGCAPFPVAYHRLVNPGRLQAHVKTFGLQPVYFCAYLGSLIEEIARKNPLLGRLLVSAANLANRATFGTLDLLRGDYHLVLRKL
jgi:hypothetical protein